jgi:hypothetical protein
MFQLSLPEQVDDRLQALLASAEGCPVHAGTTLDFGVCDLCEVEAMPMVTRRAAEEQPAYEAE